MRVRGLVSACLLTGLTAIAPAAVATAADRGPAEPGLTHGADPGAPRAASPAERGRLSARLNDLWITARAKARMFRNEEVPALQVDVDSRDGVVTLFGMVPTLSAQAAAELEVVKIDGVRRVENRLEVVPEPHQAATRTHDRALESVVRERLVARPEIAEPGLDVAVCNGVARLRGHVATADAHRIAVETVRDTRGVRDVFDQLEVEGKPTGEHAAS